MARPLEGIKVVEVSMWAFVPLAGAMLADMGAEVIKIEPHAGDPVRGLVAAGIAPGTGGFTFMYEIFNRGKRSVAIDLGTEGALEVLHKLLEDADVFLTSLLPPARRKLKIDVADLTSRHPKLIYAIGSGQGAHGPDAEKGGYDAISFWARSGLASAVTPQDAPYPLPMPAGAFGDSISGSILAGGIAAAIARRAMTGKVSVVDTSLLNSGMWAMQANIVGSLLTGVEELPKFGRAVLPNPLVNSYRTADGRYISMSMLQGQRYWPRLCEVIGRPDLIDDPSFATDALRAENITECIAVLDEIFATKPLAEWQAILPTQDGQWDTVKKVGELADDSAVQANAYIQLVDYGDGRAIRMVSSPVQFDGEVLAARPAPELGGDSDGVLTEAGFSEEEVLEMRIAGILH